MKETYRESINREVIKKNELTERINIETVIKNQSKPRVVKNFFSLSEVTQLHELNEKLPITKHNKEQRAVKKRWLQGYNKKLDTIFINRLKNELGDFKFDTLKSEDGSDILGLIQKCYLPLPTHTDTGFNLNDIIYKQTLVPLTSYGQTVIFKNRFYGVATFFTINEIELIKDSPNLTLNEQCRKSSEHIKHDGESKEFDSQIHKKYLAHEDINNLKGLEVEFIFEWSPGDMLIFDRSHLHASSSNIKKFKTGIATFLKK
jgi:hypothetical protein